MEALHLLACLRASGDDPAEAAQLLARCVAISPASVTFRADLGRVLGLLGRHGEAIEHLRACVGAVPQDRRTCADLADLLERSGRRAEAWEVLNAGARGPLDADDDTAFVALRVLHHDRRDEEAASIAAAAIARPGTDPGVRRLLLQQVGRIRDSIGDVDGAFEAFAEAKRLESLPFDPAEWVRMVDSLIAAHPGRSVQAAPAGDPEWDAPIFVACMPRSGSTLVEQVLHSHPAAGGTGELAALGQALRVLERASGGLPHPASGGAAGAKALREAAAVARASLESAAGKVTRIVNKHLHNYLHLGTVEALFPRARVIHIRRERVDNAFACFMSSLPPGVAPWSSRMEDLGVAWRQYERLMAHWNRTLSLPMLEVRYEELVEDPERGIRRIIEFAGLEWDDRCLRWWECDRVPLTPSYDQVRRPIYRSALGRAARYERFLGPLRNALGAAGNGG